jgi:SpoVK/Ycf46/Vps4 family AAA+-type ATPase
MDDNKSGRDRHPRSDSAPLRPLHRERSSSGSSEDDSASASSRSPGRCPPSGVGCDEIVGLRDARAAIQEALLLPSLFPRGTFRGLRELPKAILLYGPPGTGKTMCAQAAAAEARVRIFSPSPSGILSKWVGDSEKALRTYFRRAAAAARAPGSRGSILFLDEIDALAPARGSGAGASEGRSDVSSRRLLNELLILFTEFAGQGQRQDDMASPLLIIAATNRPQDVDEALLRRFSRRIECPLPGPEDRARLITKLLALVSHVVAADDIAALAGAPTAGWNGADIRALLADAAMAPVREALAEATAALQAPGSAPGASPPPLLAVRPLARKDITYSIARVRPTFELTDEWRTSDCRSPGSISAQTVPVQKEAPLGADFQRALGLFVHSPG